MAESVESIPSENKIAMKCPKCGKNVRSKSSRKCDCGYGFILDPKTDGIADRKFLSIIRAASKNESVFYLKDQLFTAYCNRMKMPVAGMRVVACILGAVTFYMVSKQLYPFAFFFGFAMVAVLLFSFMNKISHSQFTRCVDKWLKKKNTILHLISKPSLHAPPPQWEHGDIYDYGVEKVLIVQHDILVDFFVLNDFHAQSRALVVSRKGYPDYLLPTLKKVMEEDPELPVYYLHDADEKSVQRVSYIKNKGLFGIPIPHIIDIGLDPKDIKRIKRIQQAAKYSGMDTVPIALIPAMVLMEVTGGALDQGVTLADILGDTSSFIGVSFG